MTASNDYAVMLLATYRPRSDAAARGYDSWLRETATPFFNAQPEVVRYSAWRVVASRGRLAQCAAGAEESFEHFACFGLHSRDDVKTLLVREEVLQFVSDWTRAWSIRPEAENRAENLFLTVCERLRTNGGATAQHLAFVPFANRATPDRAAFVAWAPPEHQAWLAGLAAGTRYESWHIVERLFGDLQPEYFDLIYLPDATEWPALAEVVTTVALGERLAGPPS